MKFQSVTIMVNSRPLAEKIEAIFIYGSNRNFHDTERIFNERFPDRPICRKYLRDLVRKFTETGSVSNLKNQGRPSISEDKQIEIVAEMVVNPGQSTSRVAEICDTSSASVKRVLKKKINFIRIKFKWCMS